MNILPERKTGSADAAGQQWRKKLAGILGDVGRLFPQRDEYLEPMPMAGPTIAPKPGYQGAGVYPPKMPRQY